MSYLPFKELHAAYGFDEVAIVPGDVTVNPEMTSSEMRIGDMVFDIPVMAAAMDAVVSPDTAVLMDQVGGLGVLNLEGLYTRYEDPHSMLEEVLSASRQEATSLLQEVYSPPVQRNLVAQRVQEIKASASCCAVSVTPQNAKALSSAAVEAGADVVFVQSTVTTARHTSRSYRGLRLDELREQAGVPIVVGNCVSYSVALALMETGIDGLLVGVGPGAACTTREVVGVGVPQVTATMECAAARRDYFERTGRYVPVITDGGLRTGGDVCKAVVSGADGVMLGTPLAQAEEAPGRGFNWGMANSHPDLPRGTRIKVGSKGPLRQILFGPTSVTDGTQNLVGALKVGMGMCGAVNLQELQQARMVIAPSIKTEGKVFQFAAN